MQRLYSVNLVFTFKYVMDGCTLLPEKFEHYGQFSIWLLKSTTICIHFSFKPAIWIILGCKSYISLPQKSHWILSDFFPSRHAKVQEKLKPHLGFTKLICKKPARQSSSWNWRLLEEGKKPVQKERNCYSKSTGTASNSQGSKHD